MLSPAARNLVGGAGTAILGAFLALHIASDLGTGAKAWYFHSTPVWLLVMGAASLLYLRERARLRRRGVDIDRIFAPCPTSNAPVERTRLAPGLELPRVLTGLWQVADQERGGALLDPEAAARALTPLVDAGLCGFDVADHYGSAERVAGALRRQRPETARCSPGTHQVGAPARGLVARGGGGRGDAVARPDRRGAAGPAPISTPGAIPTRTGWTVSSI